MRIYIAARYGRRTDAAALGKELAAAGHEITARWLTGIHGQDDGNMSRWGEFALDDVQDMDRADVLIALTEPPTDAHPRGGRHVELGYALGTGKRIVLIGPRENVFCHLPGIVQYPDLMAFRRAWFDSNAWQECAQ